MQSNYMECAQNEHLFPLLCVAGLASVTNSVNKAERHPHKYIFGLESWPSAVTFLVFITINTGLCELIIALKCFKQQQCQWLRLFPRPLELVIWSELIGIGLLFFCSIAKA